jgi:hypothetical protein
MAKASAAEHYARKAQLGEDAITYAHAIKIDAEVLLGGFLKETGERAGRGGDPMSRDGTLATLPELGLTRNQSSKWQKLANIPEPQFEEALCADQDTRRAASR